MIRFGNRLLALSFVSCLILGSFLSSEGKRLGEEEDLVSSEVGADYVRNLISGSPVVSPVSVSPVVSPVSVSPVVAPVVAPVAAPVAAPTCTPDYGFLEYCVDSCTDTCPSCSSYRDRRNTQICYTPPPPDPCAGKWKSGRAFKHYWCGNGEDVTLEETGLVQDVTDYWKAEKEAKIKSDICGWMKACKDPDDVEGRTWSISRPWPWECHFWIGGFTLTLSKVTEKFPCPAGGGHDYTIELTMRDTFEEPLSPIWITCELPGSTVFDVTHTWTMNLHCPDVPCPRAPSCCGAKGQKCCGLDQCNGSLTCIDDICYDIDCGPNECTCQNNWIMECNYQFKWAAHEFCDDYVCAKNQTTGNCYCDPPGYNNPSSSPVASP